MAHQGLTSLHPDPLLDLPAWMGQRQASYRFALFDAASGMELGDITPLRTAQLTHDTGRTIKRQLNIDLGTADVAAINTISERVRVYMTFPSGVEYPMGTFMFTSDSRQLFTSGRLGSYVLFDEMFLVDQQITSGVNGVGVNVIAIINNILSGLPITFQLEMSPYESTEAWGVGTGRGQILQSLAVSGDYFSPWFDNNGVLRFIRSFDPARKIPDFDWDVNQVVDREGIIETDDLLTAPNRFVVISNAGDNNNTPIVGTVDIPSNLPHSIANRGFVVPQVEDLQVSDIAQAVAVATNMANRFTIFQRTTLSTPPDPRHDSYNVIRWQGALWLELGWGLPLAEGSSMSHLLRKSYVT